jgi:hypothetical protein
MRRFLKLMLRIFFGPPGGGVPCAGGTESKAQVLQEKIRKWEGQAEEYEAMGLAEFARRSRETAHWYRLQLKLLADPTFRRVA